MERRRRPGDAHEKANSEFVFDGAGKRHTMRKPHTTDLASSKVIEIGDFLAQAGWSPELPSNSAVHPDPAAPNLLIVVDRQGAKNFHVDVMSDDASEHVIRPYHPHHFLHDLAHMVQSRKQGQRAPEELAHYEAIADAVDTRKIVVVGDGAAKSDSAHHLTEYPPSQRNLWTHCSRNSPGSIEHHDSQLLHLARRALRK